MFTAAEYYELIVEPTVAEFRRHNGDIRLGMLSCMVAIHTLDYIFENESEDAKSARKARENFLKRTELPVAFQVVHDFANASKHCRLRKDAQFNSKRYRRTHPAIAGLAMADATYCDDSVGGIVVEWREDKAFNLTIVIEKSLRFLEAKFPQLERPAT